MNYRLSTKSKEVIEKCPYCLDRVGKVDKTGHLYVNYGKGVFYCQRCAATGPIKKLHSDWEAESDPITEFDRITMDFMHPVPEEVYDPYSECEFSVPVKPFTENILAYNYLRAPKNEGGRGLTDETIAYYGLCSPPLASAERWASRVFIPVYQGNRLVFWTARSIRKSEKKFKYLNCPARKKTNYLFNQNALKSYKDIIIAEGAFSAIAAGKNSVGIYGKVASKWQIDTILNSKPDNLYLSLDGDAHKEQLELAEKIALKGFPRDKLKLVKLLGDKEDPDSCENYQELVANAEPYSLDTIYSFNF